MKQIILLLLFSWWSLITMAQPAPLGEVIFISNSGIKEGVKPETFKAYFASEDVAAQGRKMPGTFMKLYQSDRGEHNGEFLLAFMAISKPIRKATVHAGSPFTDNDFPAKGNQKSGPSAFLADPNSYTEYEMLGAGKTGPMAPVGLLGIHYIKVKKEKSSEFEDFIINKLNPKVNNLLPDMGLYYYKAVEGKDKGSYITIFAIRSAEAREKYWPSGKPETKEVKAAFKPLSELAIELGTFLEDDSYLKPESGGAAAFFESLHWTDYVVLK